MTIEQVPPSRLNVATPASTDHRDLIAMVADATERLWSSTDLPQAISAVLAEIGTALAVQHVDYVWSSPDHAPQPDATSSSPLAHTNGDREAHGEARLTVPIGASGSWQGELRIVGAPGQSFTPIEVHVLRLLAAAIGAVHERQRSVERANLLEQSHRELGAVNDSLRRVAQSVTSDSTLIDVLKTILREVATVCGSSVGGIFLYDEADATMRLVVSGVGSDEFHVADADQDAPWFQPLPAELTNRWATALRRDELVSMDRREAERTGAVPLSMPWGHCSALNFEVDLPLMAGQHLVGALSLLFPSADETGRFDYLHGRTLAHMAAVAIHQDRLAAAARRNLVDRERERAEEQRVAELVTANASLRAVTHALAEAGDETRMFSECLSAIQRLAGADTVWLFRGEQDDGIMRLVGSYSAGRFSPQGEARDPVSFRQGFDLYGPVSRRLRASDQLVWRSLLENVDEAAYLSATLAWHRAEGHMANAVQVLCVGPRIVGFLGMVFSHHVPPTESQRQHVHSLTQLLALTLELLRQGQAARRHAEDTAILAERNRLAREMHDGIAQSFVAIQMQLKQLPDDLRQSPPLAEVMAMAVHGLNETRRAVGALRPVALLHQDFPTGVERVVQQITQSTTLLTTIERPPQWQGLPTHVEDHLFRIVQEAVANVVKHARAAHLRVELSQTPEATTVLVADDGVGFDAARVTNDGYGLESIRQRAALIGGHVAWQSASGGGTQMLVSWSG